MQAQIVYPQRNLAADAIAAGNMAEVITGPLVTVEINTVEAVHVTAHPMSQLMAHPISQQVIKLQLMGSNIMLSRHIRPCKPRIISKATQRLRRLLMFSCIHLQQVMPRRQIAPQVQPRSLMAPAFKVQATHPQATSHPAILCQARAAILQAA